MKEGMKCPECGGRNTYDYVRPYNNVVVCHSLRCRDCGWSERPLTNGEKLRRMSDEDLAVRLSEITSCDICPVKDCNGDEADCAGSIFAWLKEEDL